MYNNQIKKLQRMNFLNIEYDNYYNHAHNFNNLSLY